MSHALWWCQNIHQHIVSSVGATPETCLHDRAAVPDHRCFHLEYVDNFVVIGTDGKAVETLATAGAQALRNKGLVVHEEEITSCSQHNVKVLGWQFSGTQIRPLPHRVWRVRLAFQHILKMGAVSGKQVEKVVGHAAFIGLGRRESLSVFGETYTFIQRRYGYKHRLWSSVRREISIYIGILPLVWRDVSIPWGWGGHSC